MSLGFECCILSQEYFTHPALADLLNDSVMANGLSDHTTPPHAMQLGSMLRLEGVKGNGNQPVGGTKNVPTGSEHCDTLLTKLPNNPLNKLHNSLFNVCHVLPWALRALRGNSLCGGGGRCSRRVSLHKRRNAWLLIWAADPQK